jgi:glycosyltransferase involved in cell wall biosynthesis
MKLLYIDDIPTPYRLGVFKLLKQNLSGTFKVLFCSKYEPDRNWKLNFSDLDYEILHGIKWRPKNQKNPISFKLNLNIISKIKKNNPAIVVLCGYMHPTMQLAAWYCRKKNIPYGVSCESSFLQSKTSGFKWKLKQKLLTPIINGMSFGLPVGSKAEEYLKALGAKKQPMYYFPNCPDVSDIVAISKKKEEYETKLRNQFNIPKKNKIILFVGRLIDAKRPMDLVYAFNKIDKKISKNWTLLIVGEGALKNKILNFKSKISHQPQTTNHQSLITNIVLSGWLQPEDVYKIMSISTLMVLPSEHEPWGAVVNEAMTAGTPVIASDSVGAAYDLIEDIQTGFVFKTGNVDELKAILVNIMKDKSILTVMSLEAQKKSIKMGHEFAADNLLKVVENFTTNLR